MKKFRCVLALVLGLVLVGGLGACVHEPEATIAPAGIVPEGTEDYGAGISFGTGGQATRPLTPWLAHYEVETDESFWVQLVDLSDRTNYPHSWDNTIILKNLHYAGNLDAVKEWHWNVGVVTAVTTATTDIEWITGGARTKATQFDERWMLPEHGLSLLIRNGSLDNVVTNQVTSTASITSSTVISSTYITGTVGVGDLVLYLREVVTGANLHFSINTAYDTE